MIGLCKSDSLIVVNKHVKSWVNAQGAVWVAKGSDRQKNHFSRRLAVTQSTGYLASGLEMLGKVAK
jgi:hypothetical protein